jgi:hypothetical protein
MTAPRHRRPLPAVVFIGALTVLTAIVWVRVLDRATGVSDAGTSACTTPKPTLPTKLPFAKDVSVIVLNSTDRANLAATTKKALQKNYFKVLSAANDEPSYGGHGVLKGVGEIRFGPTAAAAATLLHYYLPNATMVRTDSSSTTVILALGEKYKKLPTRSYVLERLKQHGITRTDETEAPAPAPSATC